MSATIGKVYVDAVITDERYKECMALVHEANERIDELRELVRDMYGQLLNAYDPKELDEFDDRMRELGVEP